MPRTSRKSFSDCYLELVRVTGRDLTATEYIALQRKWLAERREVSRRAGRVVGRPSTLRLSPLAARFVAEAELSNRQLADLLGVHYSAVGRFRVQYQRQTGRKAGRGQQRGRPR